MIKAQKIESIKQAWIADAMSNPEKYEDEDEKKQIDGSASMNTSMQ